MKTANSPPKRQSKDPDWQAVNELAFIYYQDQTNKDKRKALYDELTKDRYTTKKVRGKEIRVRGPSLLLQLARKIIVQMRLADLGAGITDLTQDILHDALEKKDPISGLPLFRETGLLGGFFTKEEIDQDGKVIASTAWTPGSFDPEKAAFNTFFQLILSSTLLEYARKYNNERKKNMGLKDGLRPLPNTKGADQELKEQSPDELAAYGAGVRKEAPMQIDYEAFELWVNREFEKQNDEIMRAQARELEELLKGQPDDLREIAGRLTLNRWTGETDLEIQNSLGLTTKQFTQLKEQALPLIKPFIEEWWFGQSQG